MNQSGRDVLMLDHSEIDAYAEAYRKGEGGDPLSWLRSRTPVNVAGVDALRTVGLLIRHREALAVSSNPDDTSGSVAGSAAPAGATMSDESSTTVERSPSSARFGDWLRAHRLELLGSLDEDSGGMGEVFLAWHDVMKREMVVKIARDPRNKERFRREIELHAKLGGHPHIAVTRSSLLFREVPVLVVDYVPGPSLRRLLMAGGRLPWREACTIIRQAAMGLGHAHALGIVHRDVKPGNLVRSARDGILYVIDWGLARDTNAPPGRDDHLTLPGSPLGTPKYCPPEQAADSSAATPASDLYGLGCTWYELIAGVPPFGGDARSLRRAHAEEPAPPLDPALGVPEEVEHLLRRLLDKDPLRRFARADDFVKALDDVLKGGGEAPSRRLPRHLPLMLAAVALALAAWWFWPEGPRPAASPAVSDLVVEVFDPGGRPGRSGTIGSSLFQAFEGDDVTIRAELASPAYAYLIAFLPDGRMELCVPADESTRPDPDASPAYPTRGNLKSTFGLHDGSGLQAFAVVSSRSALPAFKDWKAKLNPPPWHHVAEVDPGLVWRSDDQSIKVLQAGKPPDDRATGYRSRGARGAVADVTDWLKSAPGVDAVQVKAFAVVPSKP